MNKYHAKVTILDGIKFASKKEARRYSELKMLERMGHIEDLELHPRFKIEINGIHICDYIADFQYITGHCSATSSANSYTLEMNPIKIVEDVKGYKKGQAWRIFRIKQQLMLAVNQISVQVI